MKRGHPHELSPDRKKVHARAVRLEWLTLAYLLSAIVLIRLTMGSSQAMKVAWLEDMLSLIPAASFLIASRLRGVRGADVGHHRAASSSQRTPARGSKVLVIGASGGVGTHAVQIAKASKAVGTGVCSSGKVELVRSIGADHVIDYEHYDFAARVGALRPRHRHRWQRVAGAASQRAHS